jgi:ferredoxin
MNSYIERKDTLIINVDYCGSCRGTCPTCVLTKDERLTNEPLMNINDIKDALKRISVDIDNAPRRLVLGMGRANHLVLPEYTIHEIIEILQYAKECFKSEEYLVEISTSLVGKMDFQINRAKKILDKAKEKIPDFDVKYLVVANMGLSSPKYWDNVKKFLDSIEMYRGGKKEESGDIIQINLSLDSLPDINWMEEYLNDHMSPVNIAWVPGFDKDTSKQKYMEDFENWMVEFYNMSKRIKLDTNIINWGERSIGFNSDSLDELIDNAKESENRLIYISTNGSYHKGYPTIMADMDPIRFDPDMVELNPNETKSNLIKDGKEIYDLIKHKGCRSCKYISSCYHSGGYKIALISQRYKTENKNICLNGLRKTFERIEENV